MSSPEEFTNVIGTRCLNTSHADLTERLEAHATDADAGPLSVDFTNVHIVTMRRTDPAFGADTSKVDWFVPDSQILKWAVNLRGGGMEERVYGPDFLAYAIRHCSPDTTHYFLGASQECLDLLLEKLKEARPELKIVGSHNGYFGDDDNDTIIKDVEACDPDWVWVGLGTPKQQSWINAHKKRFSRAALLAVGFAFDVNAGTKKDAPEWMGRFGLTWLYRLASEPRRLFVRYFYYNTMFLWLLLRQALGSGGGGQSERALPPEG